MANRCVHCGKIIQAGSKEILEGCASCGGHFFFYIRDEMLPKIKEEAEKAIVEISSIDKKKVEEDVRSILKVENEEKPVILDVESVRVLGAGKFEIDIVGLMSKKPLVFKLEEGKYVIDLSNLNREDGKKP
jgi:predicted  nucleic acid-binding Zn-ribbon protein